MERKRRKSPKTRKIISVGNSLAISLPAFMLRRFNLKEGDRVSVTSTEEGTFLVEPIKKGET